MSKQKRHVFITGIAGFIGYHLASYLKKKGDYVIGCDNFNDYYSPELKKLRAKRLNDQEIPVISCDINNLKKLFDIFKQETLTHVVHLAAQAGVRYSITNPFSYSESNLSGFLHILELCRHHQPLKLVFASSSSVYGNRGSLPFKESDVTDEPISLYAATKKAGELMAKSYHHLYQIPMVGLRYFTVYGPWGRPDMAYFSFADAIQKGKPISVFNHGKMKRDFTYIDDIIEGTVAALDYEGSYEIFNLGNNHPEELMTLISLLEEGLGKRAQLEFKGMQLGDVHSTYADISKAKGLLRFEPKTSLQEGIKAFTTWMHETYTEDMSSEKTCGSI